MMRCSVFLTALFAVGVMDEPASAWDWQKLHNNVTSASSVASARKIVFFGDRVASQ